MRSHSTHRTARLQHRSAGSPPAHTPAAPGGTLLLLQEKEFKFFSENPVFLIRLGAASRSLRNSDRMSELSVNDHLEGILSDFEGMWTVILTYFTAACFVGM